MENTRKYQAPALRPGGNWRAREAAREEARRQEEMKRKEEAERKKLELSETNFPTLSAAPTAPTVVGTAFAALAKDWKAHDDYNKIKAEFAKQDAVKERAMNNGIFIWRASSAVEEPEDEEPERPYVPPKVDSDGWSTVENKKKKAPREKTDAELRRYYAQPVDEEGNVVEDEDFNAHLAESGQRREFY